MSRQINTRKLPVGMQSFEKIRRGGYIYVDKTDMVWHIANGKQNNFLSRPRRFGKSMLTSTLKCYFEGKKELFEGLKIMQLEKEWKQRQVFYFDFSGNNTAEQLKNYLNSTLGRYEKEYGREETDENLKDRFLTLIMKATKKYGASVAVLVDEYDSPLQHTLYDNTEHEKTRNVYTSFFPALKTGEDYIKCTFLTGITKFTQLSIFSTLNNVSLIGSWNEYATVCGITREEIVENFMPELEAMAKARQLDIEQTLDEMRLMYDGYHFTNDLSQGVYNPYSVVNALDRSKISNYWTSSGGSSLLSKMLEHSQMDGGDVDNIMMDADILENADVSTANIPLFLYQSGYLTIKDYAAGFYTLGIPNTEVKNALFKIVLPIALSKHESEIDNTIGHIKMALVKANVSEALEYLKQLVSETPYAKKGEHKLENRYSFIIANTFALCGCNIEEEKQIATGRIDLVVSYHDIIMVIELKMDNNGGVEAAEAQISDRDYLSAYSAEKKSLYSVAISFGNEKGGISEIKAKRIK